MSGFKRTLLLAAFAAAAACAPATASSPKDIYYSDHMENAVEAYRKEAAGGDKTALFELASVLKEFGRNEEAFNAYRDIIRSNNSEYRAHFELAKMYYFLNSYDQAGAEIEELAFIKPPNWEGYYWWGCILMEKGEYDRAAEKFEKAIEADKRKNIIYVKLAELYEKKKITQKPSIITNWL